MDYHQSIAAVYAATCEQTVAALSRALRARGYRLARSFDLRSARHAAALAHDQYLVLLAYEEAASAAVPPVVITVHECDGMTHLNASTGRPGDSLACALLAAFDEMADSLASL